MKLDRAPLPGVLVRHDASSHTWVESCRPDLGVAAMDDATGAHLSMFFCDEKEINSSFHRIGQTITRYGLFCSLYADRGLHYFTKYGLKLKGIYLQLRRASFQRKFSHNNLPCILHQLDFNWEK